MGSKARKNKSKKNSVAVKELKASQPLPNQASEKLQRVEICGYVAVSHPANKALPLGWLYLRKQSKPTPNEVKSNLFLANIPWPSSIPFKRQPTVNAFNPTSKQLESLKRQIKSIVPNAISVNDVFPIGDGAPRLAARLTISDTETLDEILKNPNDYIYLSARDKLYNIQDGINVNDKEDVVSKWVKEHERERDVNEVEKWSEAAMKSYEEKEKRQKEEKLKRMKRSAEPDEDGFVTIFKGAPQMKASELASRKGLKNGKNNSGKKNKSGKALLLESGKGIEKSGFYRWQRKNENMLGELRDKFREDQKRVNAIRGLDKMED